jgi:hypothetical protein
VEELRAEHNLPYVSLTEKKRRQGQADKFPEEEDDREDTSLKISEKQADN